MRAAHELEEAAPAPAPTDGRIVVIELGEDGLLAVDVRPASRGSLLDPEPPHRP